MKKSRYIILIFIFIVMLFPQVYAETRGRVVLEDFAISPDGRIVAFQFLAPSPGPRGLGLYDWQTGKLIRIPNPPGKILREPSFSPDGKQLAAVELDLKRAHPYRIAIVDIDTLKISELMDLGPDMISYPVFQPSTNNIIYDDYSYGTVPHHLRLFIRGENRSDILFEPKNGFWSGIFRPSFTSSKEVIFEAIGVADSNTELKQEVLYLTGSNASKVAYRLDFGKIPEVLFPKMEKSREQPYDICFSSLSSSSEGKIMAYIGTSLKSKLNKINQINYDIFTIKNSVFSQLTDLRSLMAYAQISYDGNFVAFGSDPSRKKNFDLFIINLSNNNVVSGNLLEKIQGNIAFLSD